jgi:DNA-directed RNA polymerase I subunit RPA1
VITTILRNIQPPECGGVWMSAPTKIPAGEWGPSGSEEGLVEFQDGYFVTGILDKSHIGPSSGGLVHAVHEVYGPTIAGKLLSSLGRLLTRHLNTRAFSCGMDDLRLTPHGEARRRELLTAAGRVGLETAAGYVSLADRPDDPELRVRLEEVMRDDGKQAGLDRLMNSACDKVKDSVNKELMPGGLVKKFPTNRMQTMTVSGAKGSKVNATLISCSLGQQVLEGRRVPLMVSGKSLPCFDAFETHARAGGFVVNRFLTGIRPQEYYFHTMTGREGLIDTAVKTSRSGYLQRCLIKGMEGLTVSYDSTVRDSDGSMVQFLFGEDGIDVAKTKYLDDFSFVLRNWRSGSAQLKLGPEVFDLLSENREGITKHQRSAIKHARAAKESGGGGSALSLAGLKDPANSLVNPARFAFATSERFFDAMTAYMKANPDGLVREKGGRDSVIRAGATAAASSSPNAFQIPKKMAESLLAIKYVRGQVEPGEAVGIVAGQSVGEPSTQMTLNTFHLAGHSGKNVTLGIPRLREILMTARRTIATPSMTLRLRPGVSDAAAERFAKSISVLPLANLLDSAHVRERVGAGINAKGAVCRMYDVSLNLFPSDEYGAMYGATAAEVMRAIETRFMPNLTATVRREIKKRKATAAAAVATAAAPEIGVSVGTIEVAAGGGDPDRAAAAAGMDDEGGDDDDDDSDGENDATGAKQKSKRTEAVSYGPNDDDDDAIMRANQREVDVDGDDDEGLGRDDAEEARSSDGEEGDNTDDEAVALMRGLRVTQKFSEVTRFAADEAGGAWARFTLEFDLAATPKILLLNMVQKAVRATLVHEVPGIKTCTFTPAQEIMGHAEPASITVDGINFAAIHEHAQSAAAASSSSMDDDDDDQAPLAIVDADSIQTNDIYAVLCTYGVEACRGAIVAELAGVFSSHGITVDNRHLNLIADYMTRGGRFEPFNRLGLKGNASPFSKMSFETTVGFLKDAVLDGDWDELRNPSSQLVMGTLARVGTGTFDVVPPAKGVEVAA